MQLTEGKKLEKIIGRKKKVNKDTNEIFFMEVKIIIML